MSTLHEYLVQIPDFPGALQKRLRVRATHLENLKPYIEEGTVVFGGATLLEPFYEGQGKKTPEMTGSVMLIKAGSENKLKEWLRNDPYTKGDVWDVENAKITPFRCAVRTAM